MRRILAALNSVYIALLFISTTCIVVLIAMQIVARYIFNSPFSWTEEITLFSFCWLSFSGSAIASYEKNHLEVDFLFNRLPALGKKVLQTLIYVVSLGLGLFMVGDAIMTMGKQKGMSSVAARLPVGLYTFAIVIGFIGMTVFCAAHLFKLDNTSKPSDRNTGKTQSGEISDRSQSSHLGA